MTQVGRDDEGAEAFSLSHVECGVGLKPYNTWESGRTKSELIDAMAVELQKMPGYSVGFSQPIIDMVMDQVAGAHSDLAVKIYGEDLHETRRIAERIEQTLRTVPGAVDVAVDQEPPLPQLQIIADRDRIAQYGLNVSDVTELIEFAIGGSAISQVFVGSKSYDVTCPAERRVPEHARKDRVADADQRQRYENSAFAGRRGQDDHRGQHDHTGDEQASHDRPREPARRGFEPRSCAMRTGPSPGTWTTIAKNFT